jgi:hypothetical protein
MRNLVQPAALIDAWLELLPVAQARSLAGLHTLVMSAEPALRPDVKWGNLVYIHDRRPLLALTPHRRSVQLQLFAGAALMRQFPSLEDCGPDGRQAMFRHGDPVPGDWVISLVRAARAAR